ncbi:MAG: hypothetical protein AB1659_04495 [Thermodesulfobacteriota bacterium]
MFKKRGKSVSFDAMVKFFMHTYHIPTKRDVDKLLGKMDQIEAAIKNLSEKRTRDFGKKPTPRGKLAMTASDQVLEIIRKSKDGAGFADIQARCGFEQKKLRNIIFRLNKLGRISRKIRGRYVFQE